MYAWTVSIVQILAILVCPLTCVSGHACCGEEQLSGVDGLPATSCSLAVSSEQEDRCCCSKNLADEGDLTEENLQADKQECPPATPTEKTTCQGVCGGAIFEKPCELPAETNFLTVSPIIEDVALFTFGDRHPQDHGIVLCSSGNYGRSLRTLHASFLC